MNSLISIPRALFAASVCVLNTVFWAIFLYAYVFLRLLVPVPVFRAWCTRRMIAVGENWIGGNVLAMRWLSRIEWDIRGNEDLRKDRSYLVIANHQSWVDIVILQAVFNRRIPFVRFFLKQELQWVPILGLAWKALDFPFMKRYSKEYLAKHPEKRGEDLETTRRACDRFRGSPITVLNFLEGTRFTPAKHAKLRSPFRHLLPAKAGGMAFVLECMGDQFDAILDVTIVYPQGAVSMWDLFAGRLRRVVVRIDRLDVPREKVGGNYLTDEAHRTSTQAWVREIWDRKDRVIGELTN